jgi:hypothetical protein
MHIWRRNSRRTKRKKSSLLERLRRRWGRQRSGSSRKERRSRSRRGRGRGSSRGRESGMMRKGDGGTMRHG